MQETIAKLSPFNTDIVITNSSSKPCNEKLIDKYLVEYLQLLFCS